MLYANLAKFILSLCFHPLDLTSFLHHLFTAVVRFALNLSLMVSSDNGWHSFWKSQSQAFNQAMKISTTFFARRIEKEFKVNSEHEILDYGSGPGFLADYFETKHIRVTSLDINCFYVDQHKS